MGMVIVKKEGGRKEEPANFKKGVWGTQRGSSHCQRGKKKNGGIKSGGVGTYLR